MWTSESSSSWLRSVEEACNLHFEVLETGLNAMIRQIEEGGDTTQLQAQSAPEALNPPPTTHALQADILIPPARWALPVPVWRSGDRLELQNDESAHDYLGPSQASCGHWLGERAEEGMRPSQLPPWPQPRR